MPTAPKADPANTDPAGNRLCLWCRQILTETGHGRRVHPGRCRREWSLAIQRHQRAAQKHQR